MACGGGETHQHQQQQRQQPPHRTMQPGALVLETTNSFGADNARYNDVLNLRDDCFKTKNPDGLSGHNLIIGTIDNKTVGYFAYYIPNNDTAFIYDVCVGTPYRGIGIGSKLFKQGIAIIEAKPDIIVLQLDVESKNDRAQRLYQSAGFVRTGAYLEDGRFEIMRKELTKPGTP